MPTRASFFPSSLWFPHMFSTGPDLDLWPGISCGSLFFDWQPFSACRLSRSTASASTSPNYGLQIITHSAWYDVRVKNRILPLYLINKRVFLTSHSRSKRGCTSTHPFTDEANRDRKLQTCFHSGIKELHWSFATVEQHLAQEVSCIHWWVPNGPDYLALSKSGGWDGWDAWITS